MTSDESNDEDSGRASATGPASPINFRGTVQLVMPRQIFCRARLSSYITAGLLTATKEYYIGKLAIPLLTKNDSAQ